MMDQALGRELLAPLGGNVANDVQTHQSKLRLFHLLLVFYLRPRDGFFTVEACVG